MPRAQAIFVAQAGRKFRLFSLTMQRYEKFKALPNYFLKKHADFHAEKGSDLVIMSFVIMSLRVGR